MKILIAVDIEGIAGVVHPDDTRPGNPDYERARRQMTAEAGAAVTGALAGGAAEVVVNDSHGGFRNLIADALPPAARLITGKPRELGMMAGVDDGCADLRRSLASVCARDCVVLLDARVGVTRDERGRREWRPIASSPTRRSLS